VHGKTVLSLTDIEIRNAELILNTSQFRRSLTTSLLSNRATAQCDLC